MEITFVQGYVPIIITEHPVATLLGQLFDADLPGTVAIRAQLLMETANWVPGMAMRVSNGELSATVTATRDGVVLGGVASQEFLMLRGHDSRAPRVAWGTTRMVTGCSGDNPRSPQELLEVLLDKAVQDVAQFNRITGDTIYKLYPLTVACPGEHVRFVQSRETLIYVKGCQRFFVKHVYGKKYQIPMHVYDIDEWIENRK
jgi:hypothetical protein